MISSSPEVSPDARRVRADRVAGLVAPQLHGCEWAFTFDNKAAAVAAITRLATCLAHSGAHHFAVVGEGHTIAFSEVGRQCLLSHGLLPANSD